MAGAVLGDSPVVFPREKPGGELGLNRIVGLWSLERFRECSENPKWKRFDSQFIGDVWEAKGKPKFSFWRANMFWSGF